MADEKPPEPKLTAEQLEAIVRERNEKNHKLTSERDALAAENAKYKQAEADRQAKADADKRAADEAKLKEAGQFEEVLKSKQKSWDEKESNIHTTYESEIIPDKIRAVIVDNNIPILPEAVPDFVELIKNTIGRDRSTKKLFVRGEDGKPLMDKETGGPVDVSKHILAEIEKRPHVKRDQMAVNSSGVKPGAKGQIVNPSAFTVENALNSRSIADAWEKADPAGYKSAMRAHNSTPKMRKQGT
jgi:hypothetical protein